jgi:hypothetical protein
MRRVTDHVEMSNSASAIVATTVVTAGAIKANAPWWLTSQSISGIAISDRITVETGTNRGTLGPVRQPISLGSPRNKVSGP